MEALKAGAEGLASSEEELLLLALFGEEAEPLLQSIRQRARGEDPDPEDVLARDRDEQIRSVVRIVQETGVGEITVEQDGVRVSVRRSIAEPVAELRPEPSGEPDELPAASPVSSGLVTVESPMVGTFYRAPRPGAAPFVEEGDPVSPGQVLCVLEAMKLMNEIKAEVEAIVRRIHVSDSQPVEYGQPLFELEPLNGRPLGI
jgi:oxaloacetate decarboxylase alpha subunit